MNKTLRLVGRSSIIGVIGFVTLGVALLLGDLLGDLVAVVLGHVLALLDRVVLAGLAVDLDAAWHQLLGLGVVANLARNGLAVRGVDVLLDLEEKIRMQYILKHV